MFAHGLEFEYIFAFAKKLAVLDRWDTSPHIIAVKKTDTNLVERTGEKNLNTYLIEWESVFSGM